MLPRRLMLACPLRIPNPIRTRAAHEHDRLGHHTVPTSLMRASTGAMSNRLQHHTLRLRKGHSSVIDPSAG